MTDKPKDATNRDPDNVFADLGYSDADERETNLRLACVVNSIIARQRLNQSAALDKFRWASR